MKAIILCAGMGSRTGLTYPKCLFKLKNKLSLLEDNINKIKKLGFKNSDIILATGFKENLIKKETKDLYDYVKNKKYKSTNMIYSFFEVVKKYGAQTYVIFYADITFDLISLRSLINSKKDIVTLIDSDWLKKWKIKDDYLNDLEELKISNSKITSLGKKVEKIKGIDGRFVGITKFSRSMIKRLITEGIFRKQIKKNKKLDFTNFLMKLIKIKIDIYAIKKKIEWFEFDNLNDFKNFKNF